MTKKVSLMSRLAVYGKIKSLEMLQDPTSSASLGMCHLTFDGTLTEAHQAAKKLIENASTLNIDMKTPKMRFDETGLKAKQLMQTILVRKSEDTERASRPAPRAPEALRELRRSRSPPQQPRNRNQFNSPTIFIEYGASISPSILARDLRPWLDHYEYNSLYCDKKGIYVIFSSKREAQYCFDERHGMRIPELRVTLDLQLFLHGMDRRDDDRYREHDWRDKEQMLRDKEPRNREPALDKDLQRPPSRPRNVNPVREACDSIIGELRSLFIKDIKERASAPAIYEYLHPNRFKDLKETTEPQRKPVKAPEEAATTEISISETKDVQPLNVPALPRFKKRQSLDRAPLKARVKAPKKLVRPMNHRLNYSSSDNESEGEGSSSQRSTPAFATLETVKTEEKKRAHRDRGFDYTSSEDEEEEPVVKKLKLTRGSRIREETPETDIKLEEPISTPQKTTVKAEPPSPIKTSPIKEWEVSPAKNIVPVDVPSLKEEPEVESEIESEEEEQVATKIWRPANHEPFMEILKPKLDWGMTTHAPESVCQDNMDTVLDLDGFQTYIKDAEDWALMREVLSSTKPEQIENPGFWAWNKKETKSINNGGQIGPTILNVDVEEKLRWMSSTGASRSDGYFKIPEADKAAYLPHRKKIHQPIDTIQFEGVKDQKAVLSSRMNRVNNRRLAADVSLQKQMLGSETDILRFNQLKKRKKPVKFARSAIHNWGLYAIEPIAANEMIIEYVGEIIRQKVSERREKNYLRSGIGSSYLFRIDEATVIDATKRGGIARFINHCCTPSCTAKIIKVEGQKRIVIYALRDIAADEELTYDYKFEREQDGGERIPCLCGSPGCKGFLN